MISITETPPIYTRPENLFSAVVSICCDTKSPSASFLSTWRLQCRYSQCENKADMPSLAVLVIVVLILAMTSASHFRGGIIMFRPPAGGSDNQVSVNVVVF